MNFFTFFIVVGFLIYAVVWIVKYISNIIFGAERWCDHCKTWSVMKMRGMSDNNYFPCKKCGRRNRKNHGCPKCGWYPKYEIRYVTRVGPYMEAVDFYTSVMTFKETWNCPKHGYYQITVPASQSIDYNAIYEKERIETELEYFRDIMSDIDPW